MKRKFLLLFLMCILMGGVSSLFAQEVTIGSKKSTSQYFPARLRQNTVGNSYNYSSISQQIYTAQEIQTGNNGNMPEGKITKLAFKSNTSSKVFDKNVKVYMRNIGTTESMTAWDQSNDLKNNLVYSGPVEIDASGYLVFNLSPAFNYKSGENILIYVDSDRGSSGNVIGDVAFDVMNTTAKQSAYAATGTSTMNYGFDGSWPSCRTMTQKNVITITFSTGSNPAPTFNDTYAYPNGQYATNIFNPSLSFYAENKTHYKVLLSTTSDFLSDVRYVAGSKTEWVNDETKQIYTSTVTGLNYSQATTYYWKVIASNGGGADDPTAESTVYSFTTKQISAPGQIEEAYPNGQQGLVNPTFTWAFGSDTEEYQVIIDGEAVTEWTNPGSSTTGSYQTSGLSSGEHTWRIDAKNSVATTTGTEYSFSVASLPDNVTPISPADGATGVTSNTVKFQFAKGTTEYRLLYSDTKSTEMSYISVNNGGTGSTWTSTNGVTEMEFTIPGFGLGKKLYWAVDVKNAIGQRSVWNGGEEVAIYSFTAASTLPVANVAPENGTNNLENPVLSWNYKGNATHYQVYIGTSENNLVGKGWEARGTEGTGLVGSGSYQTTDLAAATQYFWRVDVKEGENSETVLTGDVWSFVTTLEAPVAQANPAQVVPSLGNYGTTTINWNKIETASGYNVYLGEEKLNEELITNPINYYEIPANSLKLNYNMNPGYDFYVEAYYGDVLGSVMSEAVNVKVTGTGYFTATIYKNDWYNRLEGATITLSRTEDEFGNVYEEGNGEQYEYTTNSLGQAYYESTTPDGTVQQVTSIRIQNGKYNVTVSKANYESIESTITINYGETTDLSKILTADHTVVFDVTLFNETFNTIDVYLENENWEDAQPGYYHVYLKNGDDIYDLETQFFAAPDDMTTSVYFKYLNWGGLGKGNYQFGVSKIDEEINWSDVEIRSYDVFDGSGNWSTVENWRDGELPSENANVYVLSSLTINEDEDITTGTVTIQGDGNITINGSLTANNVYDKTEAGALCINDGGQLFQNNASLEGKFVMNISNDWSASNKGWQFISSPFIDATTASFESTEGDFDLYRYDGSKENEWVNYKNTGDDSGEEPELPEVGGKSEFSFDFEDGTLTGLRAFAGEGSNAPLWAVTNDNYYSNGTNVIYSASYDGNTWMTYASINNYIVTENAYAITAESKLSWYVRHTNYYAASADVYEVVVSEDGETFTQIWSGTAETSVQEQELSLAEYAGKNLYIGFRHYCVDEYGGDALVLDNITLTTGSKTRNSNTRSFDEETFAQGVGYLASYEIQATATLVGTFNTKTSFDYKVSYTADKELANFHLLGNPFTFNMDWSKITAEGLVDGYAVVNNEGGYDYLTSGTINVGDGFFVKANAKNPSLSYDHSYVAPVLRGSEKANSINVIASGKAGKDNVVVNFAGQAEGFNKLQNFNDAIATVYVSENGKNYGIANVDENTTEVALNFDAKEMGSYTISFDINGEFETVILVDRFTGVETDMLVENEYSFIASADDNVNRFVIRLANGQEPTANSQFVYQSGEELILSIEGSVQIVDMLGRVVYSNEHASGNNRIYVGEFNDATYVVRVVNEEGVKVQKVVIY